MPSRQLAAVFLDAGRYREETRQWTVYLSFVGTNEAAESWHGNESEDAGVLPNYAREAHAVISHDRPLGAIRGTRISRTGW